MREIRAADRTVSWGYIRQQNRGASALGPLGFLGGGGGVFPKRPEPPDPTATRGKSLPNCLEL